MSFIVGLIIVAVVVGGLYLFFKNRPQDLQDIEDDVKRLNEVDKPKE